jgi:hypothetical protein
LLALTERGFRQWDRIGRVHGCAPAGYPRAPEPSRVA